MGDRYPDQWRHERVMFYEQVLYRNGHKAIGTWYVVAGWDKQKSNHRAFERFERFEIKRF
jgi:hypothetical protein